MCDAAPRRSGPSVALDLAAGVELSSERVYKEGDGVEGRDRIRSLVGVRSRAERRATLLSAGVRESEGRLHARIGNVGGSPALRRRGKAVLGHLSAMMALALFAASCARQYKPPREDQPHAIVKLRRTYEQTAGLQLHEKVFVDEFEALSMTDHARVAAAARTDALLVHPTPATIQLRTAFFHVEQRREMETYFESESYTAMESYNCGTGASYQSCTRSVTRTRSVPRQRMVTRNVEVSDGSCTRAIRIAPEAGRVYVIQYTYQEDQACALSCFEQHQAGEGEFEQKRCPVPAEDS